MALRLSWPASLRRWRRWIVTILVLLAIRVALPFAARPLLASQASKALRAQVEIGAVELSLLRCGIALRDVSVRPVSGPGSAAAEQPMIAWKRVAVAVRWLPLLRKHLLLREVVLESPRVAVDRAEDGTLNILALVPPSNASAAASPTPGARGTPEAGPAAPGSAWRIGADRLALRDGELRFRDFRVKGAEPLFVNLPELTLTDIALGPGVYATPSQLHLGASFEGGSVDVRAHLTQQDDRQALTAEVAAQNIPLHRAPYYVPAVGWRTLDAWLDSQLSYRFDSKGQNEVRGSVVMRDVVVRMPGLEEPAIEYRRLKVSVDPLDLVGRRVHVSELEVTGATAYVGRPGGHRFPLLKAVLERNAAGESKPVNAAGPTTAGTAAAPSPPWHWSLSRMHVTDSRIRLLRTQTPLDVGVEATVSELADDAERPAPLLLALHVGGGSLTIAGAVRLAGLGAAGTVRVVKLPLAELLAAVAVLPTDLLQAAEFSSELTIEAGMAVSGNEGGALAPGEARVRGRLSLSGLRAGTPGAEGFTLSANSIEVGIAELRAPGVVPGARAQAASTGAPGAAAPDLLVRGKLSLAEFLLAGADAKNFAIGTRSFELNVKEAILPGILPGAPGGGAAGPMRIALGDLRVGGPAVRVTRTADGIVLPSFAPTKAPPPGSAGMAAAAQKVEGSAAGQPGPPPIEVTLEAMRLEDGDLGLADRTVKPFFEGRLAPLRIELRGLRWPALAFRDLRVAATSAEQGKITATGSLDPTMGHLELHTEKIALPPFNPYATTLAGYSIGGGRASIASTVAFNKGDYDASNSLTLHNLDLRGAGGESLFQQTFGIPLSMALALMRDSNGDIALNIPVQMDAEGVKVGVGTIIRGALQRAIMGALASPLKLMGAVFGGGKVESVPPTSIAFRLGRSEFAAGGVEQVEQLAALLASRPGIVVTLATVYTPTDVRWLREQALLAEWDKEGFFGKMRNLPQRGARNAISAALQARKRDQEGKLDPDDAATLDRWLDERAAIPEAQLQALSEARLQAVERVLREEHGLDPGRMKRGQQPPAAAGDVPAVQLELGAVGSP